MEVMIREFDSDDCFWGGQGECQTTCFLLCLEMPGNARISAEQLYLSTRSQQKALLWMDIAGARELCNDSQCTSLIKLKGTPEFTHGFLKGRRGTFGSFRVQM